MVNKSDFQRIVQESIQLLEEVLEDSAYREQVDVLASHWIDTLSNGGKIIFAGNGGSFADAIHLSAELVCRFQKTRRALPAIALGTNGSIVTAVANDFDYTKIFAREFEALAAPGDLLIAISTSGQSPNILELVHKAIEMDIKVFGLTGRSGGQLKTLCPCLCVPGSVTARVQEVHILTGHYLCGLVEDRLF